MKKTFIFLAIVTFCFTANLTAFAADTYIGQAIIESGKASYHASSSAAYALVASGQVVSAAAAVPFAIAGSVGAVSNEIANDLIDAATTPPGKPLEITDITVMAGPSPDEALHIKGNSK